MPTADKEFALPADICPMLYGIQRENSIKFQKKKSQ
jgi:hypothetical protein